MAVFRPLPLQAGCLCIHDAYLIGFSHAMLDCKIRQHMMAWWPQLSIVAVVRNWRACLLENLGEGHSECASR
jgi:hypothetical protein